MRLTNLMGVNRNMYAQKLLHKHLTSIIFLHEIIHCFFVHTVCVFIILQKEILRNVCL